jgi:ABC-2 type transport system permease protein
MVRAEHFALIPVPPRRLAVGLLGTAFAGITTAVTLLAFISLVVFGARLGVLPALVAVPVVVLQLVLVVLLSRLAVTVFGQVARSRIGSAVVGVLVAGLLILSQSGWMLAVAVRTSGLLSTGVTPAFATLVRALPSGWGLYAVEAAGRSDWLTAVGVLAGLAAAIALLLLAWSWKLGSPRAARATIRGARRVRIRRAGPLSGAVGGRQGAAYLVARPASGADDSCQPAVGARHVPVAADLRLEGTAALGWPGHGADGGHLVGQPVRPRRNRPVADPGDPGAERNDVHGRQRAFLFLFGPVVTVAAVALTALAGPAWTWPWVLALTPALLGGGIGLLAWMSIAALAPSPDPHRRPDNPMDNAGGTGPTYVMFWVASLPCLPAVGMVLAGTLLHSAPLRWAGIPVGAAVGVLLYAWLGHAGYRRLEARGPELLLKMRAGRSSRQPRAAAATRAGASARGAATIQMPRKQGAIIGLGIPLGAILLFPQGIVPAVLKLAHGRERIWFLPLYLPKPLQWPACFVMIILGVAVYCYVLWTMRQLKKSSREPRAGKGGGRSLKSALTRIGTGQT